jgi:hypothetical protein
MSNKEALQIIWDALYVCEYHMQEGHGVFHSDNDQQKWDEICEAMARLHEELDVPHEDID